MNPNNRTSRRVEHLKRVREALAVTPSANAEVFENLRENLRSIGPAIRDEALLRLDHVIACSAVFAEEPKRYPVAVRKAFDELILFLNDSAR